MPRISEETLKTNIRDEYFKECNYIPDFHKIDFVLEHNYEPTIWGEAKKDITPIDIMFSQLIFTIYKPQKEYETPKFLAAFDPEKIIFIPFSAFENLFNELKNADFNWNVRPSDTTTKEFKKISAIIKDAIERKNILPGQENIYDFKQLVFYFNKDKNELEDWIANNILTVDTDNFKG